MGLQNLFSTPIYTYLVPNNFSNIMESLVIPRLDQLKRYGKVSTDFYSENSIISPKEISPFLNLLKEKTNEYSKESNLSTSNKIEYWVQDYTLEDTHEWHSHPGSLISGTYYIRANEYAGHLSFHNPNPFYTMTLCNSNLENQLYHNIAPQKGLLVLFPSWLSHKVNSSPYPNKCIRTSFSFNYGL